MTERRVGPPAIPPGARVVDGALFRLLLDMEVQKAQRLRYSLSVVALRGSLSPPMRTGQDSLTDILAQRVRATDVASARDGHTTMLLLIDADVASLPIIFRRLITGFEAVPWAAGVASYPKSASNPAQLVEQATSMLARSPLSPSRGLGPSV